MRPEHQMHTLAEFARVFGPLAIQLRATDADEATIRVYHETLKDVPLEFLTMAAREMGRTAEWFPKTSEWRAAASKVEAERRRQQRELLANLAEPLCQACNDTGWALDAQERAHRCSCHMLRRLELLGVRAWPKMIAAEPQPQSVTLESIKSAIKSRGLKVVGGRAR